MRLLILSLVLLGTSVLATGILRGPVRPALPHKSDLPPTLIAIGGLKLGEARPANPADLYPENRATLNMGSSSARRDIVISPMRPGNFVILTAGGNITISGETGKVTLNNVTLDEASKQFWDGVSDVFPMFQKAVIAGYKARMEEEQSVDWRSVPITTGRRSDGVLVWKYEPSSP